MFLVTAWKEKRRIKNCYDLTSNIYNKRYLEEQENKYKRALLHLNLKSNSNVLDVGCGSGLLFSFVSSKVEKVVGIDISSKLLQKAKKEKNEINIHLIQADADHLPFQRNKFDTVFAFTVLQNMPSPLNTLKEIKFTVKNDGHIVLTGLKKVFSLKMFRDIIKKSSLKTIAMDNDPDLKGFVTINIKEI